MTEIYCEFKHGAPVVLAAPLAQQLALLACHTETVRRRIVELMGDVIDVGVARPSPPRVFPIATHVEIFFEESSLRNQLSRLVEAEAEALGLAVHVDLNTSVSQLRLAVVAFDADPRAAIAAVRRDLPHIPLSFDAAGNDDAGVKRYAVIAHNVRRITDFDDRRTIDAVDGILARQLSAGSYRRCGRS